MVVVQRPSLPHHIPFIEVVGLSWPALISHKPSLELKARQLYSRVIKMLYVFWKGSSGGPSHYQKQTCCKNGTKLRGSKETRRDLLEEDVRGFL